MARPKSSGDGLLRASNMRILGLIEVSSSFVVELKETVEDAGEERS